jgi:basic membrane protein A and related proteins
VARAMWTALAVVAALVALTVGVAGCGSSEKGTDVRKVALVAPFGDDDPDWTLQATHVLEEFPRTLRVGVDTADASETDDIRAVLEQVSNEGNQLVIAHDSAYADAAEAVAKETRVPALVWGERDNPPDGLIGQITVKAKEAGYVAGIIAVKASNLRRLGIVIADDGSPWALATWNRMAGGFVAGARSIDPRVRFQYAQVGSDGQATAAETRAAGSRMMRAGMQHYLILGGSSAVGAQRATEAKEGGGETLYIGAVSDKSSTVHVEESGAPYLLGSIVWDLGSVLREAVRDVRAGTFGDHPYVLSFRNGRQSIYASGRAPADAVEAAEQVEGKLESGAIDVPDTPTSDAVDALIAGDTPEG